MTFLRRTLRFSSATACEPLGCLSQPSEGPRSRSIQKHEPPIVFRADLSFLRPSRDSNIKQETLFGLPGLASANITVDTIGGGGGACQDFSTVNTSIAVDLEYGNYPLQVNIVLGLV